MNLTTLELLPEQVEQFSQRFNLSKLQSEVFLRRGIVEPEEIRFFLDSNIRSTHSPFLFNEMENVVERLSDAAGEGEKVLVCGDRDVDGITATALLVRKLRSMGGEVSWRLPMHDDPYGLTEDAVRLAQQNDITLIVTVDCGITNLDEIDLARSLGIDVIVIDHHNPQDELPDAVGIVNPKVEDSGYPFAGLCAAALVAKVNFALDFYKTELYGQEQCLINIRPGNGSLVFEAVKLRNLIEVSRLSETIVLETGVNLEKRIVPFIQGQALYVYDQKSQLPLFKQLFGGGADIYLQDLATETARVFPELADRSLIRMIPGSRAARFSNKMPGEIDILKQLMVALLQARLKEVYKNHEDDLALVAMSTVADMMPMRDENRIFVRKGHERLQNLRGSGLHALLLELGLVQPPLAIRDIGWRLTPVLNSSGRLGKPDIALKLLLSEDPSETNKLVKDLVSLNDERKRHGDQAWKRIASDARTSLAQNGNRFILVRDDQIPRGITGILAGKLSREFNVPSAVLAQVGESLVGSVRTARGVRVTDFLSQFGDILVDWGGHDAAGGFYLMSVNYTAFCERLDNVISNLELETEVIEEQAIDVLIDPDRMTEELWKVEETFSPYGQESDQVLYCCSGARIKTVDFIGKEQKKHLKLTVDTGKRQWPAVFWDSIERFKRDFDLGDKVDILFRLERNNYGQTSVLQLNLVDIARSK